MNIYQAKSSGEITYLGNKIFSPIKDVRKINWPPKNLDRRVYDLSRGKNWYHIHKIDSSVFNATVAYFKKIRAEWVNLPLTTKMISSPGEVYAGQVLNYTTDTLPLEIRWFNTKERVFLSESSQFYLELRLIMDNVDKVFSIYNSFRKEKADFTHLSEFQHIEFEGHVTLKENTSIFINLIDFIINYLLEHNEQNLAFFLNKKELNKLTKGIKNNTHSAPFVDVLDALFKETKNDKYKDLTMKNFGSWEEIMITQIYKGSVLITNFPMLQIPFYHKVAKNKINNIPLAENADLILQGYRETVGSGVRVSNAKALAEKARIFHLPEIDYKPYLDTRRLKKYRQTSGFGLGWQRLTQWLLKLPFIWDTTPIPRGHTVPRP